MAKTKENAAAKNQAVVALRLDRKLYSEIDNGVILEFTEMQDGEDIRGVELWVSSSTAAKYEVGIVHGFHEEPVA